MAAESALVARQCEEAKTSKELILDTCGLRKFPDAIFFLIKGVELQRVSLAHNQLQKLTPKLGVKFATITILDLSHNQFSSLPDQLSNLKQLTDINLSHNMFDSFPRVLCQLNSLTKIDLSANKITDDVHPRDFDTMQTLETVDLTGNPLNEDIKTLLHSIVRVRAICD